MPPRKDRLNLVGWEQRSDCAYRRDYDRIFRDVAQGKLDEIETCRHLASTDLFFLLIFGLRRFDANHPFIVRAIKDVEDGPDSDTVDIWAREHYKSTVLTYAEPIQSLINNPEERIGIFSHTRPQAKKFLRQIKFALQSDMPFKRWFPEIFYRDPRKDAPKWSEDDGLFVKRTSTAREASVEAWGLVDGQPVGAHYTRRIYDDIVTRSSVGSAEMIRKTKTAFEESESLGTDGGTLRIIGTHWSYHDLYMDIRRGEYGAFTIRQKPCWDSKRNPVLLSKKRLQELERKQGKYVFACQQLLEPVPDKDRVLNPEELRKFDVRPSVMNKYLIVDPAGSKKKGSDKTSMWVVGVDDQENRFVLDGRLQKMSLTDRWEHLSALCKKHRPLRIGYEKYGMQSDKEHMEVMQRKEGVYLPRIQSLGGTVAKKDRVLWLQPLLEGGRLFVPSRGIVVDGVDIVEELIEQMNHFPYAKHDDAVDSLSRIQDPELKVQAPSHSQDSLDALEAKIVNLYDMV